MNASSLPARLSRAYHEFRRPRAEVFQPDRYSHRECQRRRERQPPLREWWRTSTPLERILRLWWWCFCALIGLTFGAMVAILAGAAVIAFG